MRRQVEELLELLESTFNIYEAANPISPPSSAPRLPQCQTPPAALYTYQLTAETPALYLHSNKSRPQTSILTECTRTIPLLPLLARSPRLLRNQHIPRRLQRRSEMRARTRRLLRVSTS
jgi:hypothetical protein